MGRKTENDNQEFVLLIYLYSITAAAENTLISRGNTFSTCVFFESKTNFCANGLNNFSVFQIECMFLF